MNCRRCFQQLLTTINHPSTPASVSVRNPNTQGIIMSTRSLLLVASLHYMQHVWSPHFTVLRVCHIDMSHGKYLAIRLKGKLDPETLPCIYKTMALSKKKCCSPWVINTSCCLISKLTIIHHMSLPQTGSKGRTVKWHL
jgi:hypothetical protein